MKAVRPLAAVAVTLALIGGVIAWTTGFDFSGDDYDAEAIGELCDSIDAEAVLEIDGPELEEEGRSGEAEVADASTRLTCEVRFVTADEDASDYLAVTVDATAHVAKTVNRASETFAGAVDHEESEGRDVQSLEAEDEAVMVAMPEPEGSDPRQYRSHVRSSNAVMSVTLIVSGSGWNVESAQTLPADVAESTLDVMRSE